MTLASMHLVMFLVTIDFCNQSSPNSLWKIHVLIYCACQAEVVVNAESKVQSWNCKSYWNLEVSARVPRLESAMFLFANCSHCILWHAIFGETFIVKGGNFAKHIFVKCNLVILWHEWSTDNVYICIQGYPLFLWIYLYFWIKHTK